MKQWLHFESEDFNGNRHNLRVFIPEDCDIVTFYANMKEGADFTKQEAIGICRELLNLLGDDL